LNNRWIRTANQSVRTERSRILVTKINCELADECGINTGRHEFGQDHFVIPARFFAARASRVAPDSRDSGVAVIFRW